MEKIYIFDKDTNITYYLVGVKSISPQMQATLTEYPTPEGGSIADHLYNDPNSLSLQVISDGYDNIRKSYYVTQDGNVTYLSYEMFKELTTRWITEATLLDIQTLHALFKNMVLISKRWTESSSSWSRFSPSFEFKEARISQIYTTTVSALNVNYGADYTEEESNSNGDDNGIETKEITAAGVIGSTASGVAIGAAIGSIIPGVGTAIGAAVGGVVGFFKSIF